MENKVVEFLKESNNIEDEWDDTSLAQAIYAWNYVIEEEELVPSVVLKTHEILMQFRDIADEERGQYRKRPVWVGGREGKKSYAIPDLITNWCIDVNNLATNGKKEFTAILDNIVKEQHVRYESIHPFIDGNGRTGRIFLNWTRIKLGLPILVIKEKEKWDYYSWFKTI